MVSILIGCFLIGTVSYFYKFSYRNRYTIPVSTLFFLVSILLLSICNYKGINFIASFIVCVSYFLLQYEGRIVDRIESFILYSVYLGLSTIVSLNVISLIDVVHVDSFHTNKMYIPFICLNVILLVFLLYSDIMYRKINSKIKLPFYSKYILLLPAISFIIILVCCHYIQSFIPSIIILFALISISLISEYIYIKTIESLHTSHEMTLQRYMETSSQNKYNLLNQQYQNSFNLLHEIMHKCNELILHMKDKNYTKVEEELHTITSATFKEFNEIYSNSVVFNTLLSNRKELLKKYNITVSSTIQFNNFDFISFSNQVDLFNTLLDFVIEEAKQSNTNKNVFIKSNMVAGQVILSFRFANNKNKDLQSEITATLQPILQNYNTILSVNDIDETTTSLLLVFQNKE